jgi:enoyl-[acyl-carrier protein] reductase III
MPDEFGQKLERTIPAGRHVTAADVATLVAFLCSPESEMIVGQTIVIDGGVSLLGLITHNA